MTTLTKTEGHAFPAPPEPDLTPEVAVERAVALAETLVDRQAETEERGYYAEDIHESLRAAGFYRLLVPRRYGGYEFGIDTFLRVSSALARGCPSTGWMYCLGATHAIVAATLFDEQAQAELFRDGDFISPATIVPGGSARPDGDGWIIEGTWKYCSGSPYATHMMAHTLIGDGGQPPTPMLFAVPRSQWRRLDDWGGQLGLRGSGSHGIKVDGARIPGYLALPGTHLSESSVSGGTPGLALHGNPQYGGGPLSYMVLEIASLTVGTAQGALDAYDELMVSRTTLLPPIVPRTDDPDYQFWYAEAAGMIATAEAAVHQAVRRWQEIAADGPGAFTREADLRLATICRHAIRLCWQAIEKFLFPTAGSSSVRHGERVERVWRDLSMMHSHAGFAVFLPMVAGREYTRARFGRDQ